MSCPVCHRHHHATCHECPHHAEVQAGRWSDVEYHLTPCSGCSIPSDDRARHIGGREIVSLESLDRRGDRLPEVEAVTDDCRPLPQRVMIFSDDSAADGGRERMSEVDMAGLSRVLAYLLTFDTVTREVVIKRLAGEEFREIADHIAITFRMRFTVQALHSRLKRAARDNPTLAILFRSMTERQKKRRKHVHAAGSTRH